MTKIPYTCECCGGTFEGDRSTEDAIAEALPKFPIEDLRHGVAVVCENCYVQLVEHERKTGAPHRERIN
jgi:hypothetical protein